MRRVKVGQFAGKHIAYLPFFVAKEVGLFAGVGLEAEHYPAGNDDEVYQDVLAGRADFGISDPTFVARGKANEKGPRVIAALIDKACLWGYTHHPELPQLKLPQDFVTLRFSCFPRPSTTFELLYGYKSKNYKLLKSMEIVETEIGYQADLLASDKADVVIDIEPMISYAESKGYRIVLSVSDLYPQLLFTGVVASLQILEKEPEVAEKFVLAIQRALRICREDRTVATKAALSLYPGLPEVVINKAIERMLSSNSWPDQALIQPESWRAALRLRQETGEVRENIEPEIYLDQRFARAALGA